jgi:flavin-dependent dehydrogenase
MPVLNGSTSEAVVIGAGPAGAVAACLLARAGIDTTLIERSSFPRPKLCGGCLAQSGFDRLQSCDLALLPSLESAPVINQLDLHSGVRSLSLRLPCYRVVDRARFDQDLVSASVRAGVRFFPETTAQVAPDGAVEINQKNSDTQTLKPRVIIIADGLKGSSLKHHPAFAWRIARRSRVGIGATIKTLPPLCDPHAITMFHNAHGYLGVAPMHDGRAVVASAADPDWIKERTDAPPLVSLARVLGVELGNLSNARTHGAPPLTRKRSQIEANGRILLVGDSIGYIEPFTGEGMSWAIEDAEMVIEHAIACCNGRYNHGNWTRAHAHAHLRRSMLCKSVLNLLRREMLVRTTMSVCARSPMLTSMLSKSVNKLQQRPSLGMNPA